MMALAAVIAVGSVWLGLILSYHLTLLRPRR